MTHRALSDLALAPLVAILLTTGLAHAQFAGRNPAECPPMSTGDLEVYAYQVRAGDSCGIVSQRLFGDRDRDDIIHAYNPGMGPPPHRLVPGTSLCLPRRATARDSGPAARITAIRQDVRSRPPTDTDWLQARLGQGIDRGARVNTLERAFAELTFRDTSIVTLRGDSLVVVYGDSTGTVRRTATEATLERGALRTRLGELRGGGGNALSIRTPSSEVSLSGGSAVTSVDAESTTRVSNHGGSPAQVHGTAGGDVRVAAGMGSIVRNGQAPSRPRALPAAPTWAPGQPARFVGVAELTSAYGEWEPVTGARVYRVEIARQLDGRDLVAQIEVPSAIHRFEIHRLPPGTYHVHISSIDGDFLESRPSAPWTFEILLGQLERPGQPALDASAFDYGDASEEPEPLAVLPGTRLIAPAGVTCGVQPDALGPAVELRTAGDASIVCRASDGSPVGGIAMRVSEVSFARAADAADLAVIRDEESVLSLSADSAVALPSTLEVVGEGLEVLEVTRAGDRFSVRVRANGSAPDVARLTLRIGADGPILATVPVAVRSRGEEAPPPTEEEPAEPAAPLHQAWQQTLGTTLMSSLVGVRDPDRGGVGVWLAGAYFGAVDGQDRLRGTAGVHAALIDDRLHLELASAVDFGGTHDLASQRGSGDLWAAAGYSFTDLRLLLEVGAFFPTQQGIGGLGVTRLLPSLHFAFDPIEEIRLRTRQGFFVDLNDSGNAAWVSAYAFDARLAEVLTLGAEVQLTIGQEDQDLLLLPTAALSVGVFAGPVVLSVAARLGLSSEAWDTLGPYTLLFLVEGGSWETYRQ